MPSCSFYKTAETLTPSGQSREIANSDLEALLEEFRGYYDANLSADRKAEIKTVQENLLKYLIDATESSDAYKIQIYRDANNYFNKVYPLVLQNIRNEKLGIKEFKEIKKHHYGRLKKNFVT